MRVLILFLVFCMNTSVFGQVAKSLTDELNQVLKDELVRGTSYSVSFKVQANGEIIFSEGGDQGSEQVLLKIQTVLSNFGLLDSGSYYLHVYWDLYSVEVYTSIGRLVLLEGFPNYTNYYSSPITGYKIFAKRLLADLKKNGFDFSQYVDDIARLEVYMDKKGDPTFIGSNKILPYLDRVKEIPWQPTIYYGKPAKSMVVINLSPFSKDTVAIRLADMSEVIVLDAPFERNLVKIQSGIRQVPIGKLVVSFVLNAVSECFENPIIHRGQRDKAIAFIDFIREQQSLAKNFYWQEYPESNRYYFYIN